MKGSISGLSKIRFVQLIASNWTHGNKLYECLFLASFLTFVLVESFASGAWVYLASPILVLMLYSFGMIGYRVGLYSGYKEGYEQGFVDSATQDFEQPYSDRAIQTKLINDILRTINENYNSIPHKDKGLDKELILKGVNKFKGIFLVG